MGVLRRLFQPLLSKHSYHEDVNIIRQNWKKLLNNQEKKSFSLEVRKSTIINAGYGVICKGFIPENSLVALYPGKYYPQAPVYAVMNSAGDHLVQSEFLRQLNETMDSSYQIHCNHHGGFIDGKSAVCLNSYCVGHLINHPPPQLYPNVRPVDFVWNDLTNASDEKSDDMIYGRLINPIGHGVWYIDPTTNDIVHLTNYSEPLVGLALLATRDINDEEELLLNYNYDKYTATPSWYHRVE